MKWSIGLFVGLLPMAAAAEPLELVCAGQATNVVEESSDVTVSESNGDQSTGSISSRRRVKSEVSYRIRVDGAAGSIRIPPSQIPTLRSGGKDGWWPLSDVVISDDRISATYRLNFLNKGKLAIDRGTGAIDMTAYGLTFSGTCERAPAVAERKF
ncbi:MAG: hypothetical protein JHD15_19405 [Phenylobacterium sp.]|uniref:hypothetical protein n=1 Tax=Phenylobacterium sp. TaxID=1871053 RepID=UPI001A28A260|nr:hypothetical protein [Phenylobacterium sp.]MBJ7412506.1 hypothetical protein [Phenylobacterium sp.]